MELVDKIRQALDETERIAQDAVARGAFGSAWRRDLISCVEDVEGRLIVYGEGTPTSAQADHIARHDPAAVLRRCTADRKILDLYGSINPDTCEDPTDLAYEKGVQTGLRLAIRRIAEGYGIEP